MDPEFQELARAIILDHSQHPRNAHELEGVNISCGCGKNPSCGDEYIVYLELAENNLNDIAFTGEGCAISKASISIMTERLKGRSVEDFKTQYEKVRKLVTEPDGLQGKGLEEWGDLLALGGVYGYPQRVTCAMLGWNIVKDILA